MPDEPSRILWTVLPRGVAGGEVRFAVFVSAFVSLPDGASPVPCPPPFDDWPGHVGRHLGQVSVRFAGDDERDFDDLVATRLSSPPSSDLWRRLFAGCATGGFQRRSHAETFVSSNRSFRVQALLEGRYESLRNRLEQRFLDPRGEPTLAEGLPEPEIRDQVRVASWFLDRPLEPGRAAEREALVPESQPDGDVLVRKRFRDWVAQLPRNRRHVLERRLHRLSAHPLAELNDLALTALATATQGFKPTDPVTFPQGDTVTKDELKEAQSLIEMATFHHRTPHRARLPGDDLGFHQRLALLGNYPALLPPLGLVLEFRTERLPGPALVRRVRLEVGDVEGFAARTPWTMCELTGDRFRARVLDETRLKDGMLPLGQDRFRLQSFDADGGALKLQQAVMTLYPPAPGSGPPAPGSSPPEACPEAPPPAAPRRFLPASLRSAGISLLEEDRAAGVFAALDKLEAVTPQHPGEGRLSGSRIELFAEDLVRGYIVEVFATAPGAQGRWYSLCWRRERHCFPPAGSGPEMTLGPVERNGLVRLAAAVADDTLPAYGEAPPDELQTGDALFRWDGFSLTVPSPGPTVDDPPASAVPDPAFESSFEVAPSHPLPPLRFGSGYRFRAIAADLAGEPMNPLPDPDSEIEIPSAGTFHYRRYDPVPPPAIVLTSGLDLGRRLGESLRRLALRTGDRHVERCLLPPRCGFRLAEQHGMFDARSPHELGGLDEVELTRDRPSRDRSPAGRTPEWALPEDPLSASPIYRRAPDRPTWRGAYLPDPLARTLCLRMEELVSGRVTVADPRSFYPGDRLWPRARPILLRLVGAGQGAQVSARWETSGGLDVLIVHLPPAHVVRLQASCGVAREDLGRLALLGLRGDEEAVTVGPLAEIVLAGWHPMVTPFEEVVLVHPVPRPLSAPALASPPIVDEPARRKVPTAAKLDFTAGFDRKSTGKLELLAGWQEWVDEPREGDPYRRRGQATVKQFTVPSADEVRATVSPRPRDVADAEVLCAVQTFGDTRHRLVDYSLVATSRFVENYVDARTVDRGAPAAEHTMAGPARALHVPSAARPPRPDVYYVVPTFGWSPQGAEEAALAERAGPPFRSLRKGGGLRVYLRRPWFGSGDDELLGVVLLPGGGDAIEDKYQPLVTQWGGDPIWPLDPGFVSRAPALARLAEHRLSRSDLVPAEDDEDPRGRRVEVAGYEPVFDPRRKLWYCDVVLAPVPTYYTFIRLALARFQPHSLAGLELSRVVLADFAQLVPDRSVTVTRLGSQRRTLLIQVMGLPNLAGNRFEVTVQRKCSNLETDLGWVPDPDIVPVEQAGAADVLWAAEVRFPAGCGARRIVVRELERLDADGPGGDLRKPQPVERLVYADVLEL